MRRVAAAAAVAALLLQGTFSQAQSTSAAACPPATRTTSSVFATKSVVFGVGCSSGAAPAATLVVNNSTPMLTGWGGVGMNHMGFTELAISATNGMTATTKAAEYARTSLAGIKHVSTWVGSDWSCTSYPTGCNQWGQADFVAFEAWLQKMKDAGIHVALKMGWDYTSDICQSAVTGHSCTPSGADLVAFAHYVSDSLGRIVNTDGFTNVFAAQFFTEPDNPLSPIPGGANPKDYYLTVVAAVRAQIVADDAGRTPILPRVLLVGANTFSGVPGDAWPAYLKAHGGDASLDVYSTHSYCGQPAFTPFSWTATNCDDYAAWQTRVAVQVAAVSPKPLIFDEGNFLGVTGTSGNEEYRATSDAGVLNARLIDGVARGGARYYLPWMSQDERWVDGSYLYYGLLGRWPARTLDVPPSWYAVSLAANLTSGTTATTALYNVSGTTSTLHATGYAIPGGDYALEVINEGGATSASWALAQKLSARTWYRYVFNGEDSPMPRPNPAYLLEWDRSATVTNFFPSTVIPGHSVVFWSTKNLAAPTSVSLSTSATWTASDTTSGGPANMGDGNTTHVFAVANQWQPSGPGGWIQGAWATSQTFNKIRVSMVGTSAPRWWADWSTLNDTLAPAGFDVQWSVDGSTWNSFSPAISVTTNSQFDRWFTFTPVATAKYVRLTNTGSITSKAYTELGVFYDASPPDTALLLRSATYTGTSSGTQTYHTIATTSYAIQAGDTFEYDMWLSGNLTDQNGAQIGTGGVDVKIDTGCSNQFFEGLGSAWQDQNAISGSPAADVRAFAYAQWYHRVLPVPACAVGHTAIAIAIASIRNDRVCSAGPSCTGTTFMAEASAFFDNIVWKHSGGAVASVIYDNGGPQTVETTFNVNMQGHDVAVVPRGNGGFMARRGGFKPASSVPVYGPTREQVPAVPWKHGGAGSRMK